MADRLRDATSPYLLQHADNPVDWYPWGIEALFAARARDEGEPILLSIGYAACHWCHVMAHDRSRTRADAAHERPVRMIRSTARSGRTSTRSTWRPSQAMTGQGGWPMTVFLTPAGEPFYGGTYFPPTVPRGARMRRLLTGRGGVGGRSRAPPRDRQSIWRSRAVQAKAGSGPDGAGQCRATPLADRRRLLHRLESIYDARFGGFGGAPKFPPSMVLEFLLRHGAGPERPGAGPGRWLPAPWQHGARRDLRPDRRRLPPSRSTSAWLVPHFEKMLYDNSLLARVYAHWWRRTGSALARRSPRIPAPS